MGDCAGFPKRGRDTSGCCPCRNTADQYRVHHPTPDGFSRRGTRQTRCCKKQPDGRLQSVVIAVAVSEGEGADEFLALLMGFADSETWNRWRNLMTMPEKSCTLSSCRCKHRRFGHRPQEGHRGRAARSMCSREALAGEVVNQLIPDGSATMPCGHGFCNA